MSRRNQYIQSASLDGRLLNKAWIEHSEVVGGGTLVLRNGTLPEREVGERRMLRLRLSPQSPPRERNMIEKLLASCGYAPPIIGKFLIIVSNQDWLAGVSQHQSRGEFPPARSNGFQLLAPIAQFESLIGSFPLARPLPQL